MKELFEALAKAQGMIKPVHKGKVNPQFKSKYATLDDILDMLRPILAECHLAVVQTPIMEGDQCGVETRVTHSSGNILDCGRLLLPLGRTGGAQGAGSSLTYARRYAISAIFGISCDEDDDGNTAQKQAPQKAPMTEEQKAIQTALKAFAADHGAEKTKELVRSLGVEMASDLPKGSLTMVMEAIANHE